MDSTKKKKNIPVNQPQNQIAHQNLKTDPHRTLFFSRVKETSSFNKQEKVLLCLLSVSYNVSEE